MAEFGMFPYILPRFTIAGFLSCMFLLAAMEYDCTFSPGLSSLIFLGSRAVSAVAVVGLWTILLHPDFVLQPIRQVNQSGNGGYEGVNVSLEIFSEMV